MTQPHYIDLLPCPFCGPSTLKVDNWGPWYVKCEDCDARQTADTKDRAIAEWNRRPAPMEAVAYAWASEWTGKGRQAHALHTTEQEAAYNAEWMNGRVVPLYTEKPAAIELSKNLGELNPDALPGDLREKIAAIIDANKYEAWTVDRANQMADAILSLIQSERGEP